MINSQGVSEQLELMYEKFKQMSREVFALVSHMGTPAALLRDANLLTEFAPGTLCFVQEGYLKLLRGKREIRMYSGGDFVPPTGGWTDEYRIISDFKSDLITFSHTALLDYAGKDVAFREQWAELCAMERRLHLCLCGEFAPEVLDFEMVVKNFAKGEVIISPDEPNDSVYEMISGKAEVFINETLVGTIGNNEMFGETELLAPEAARAKIIASKNCFIRILEPRMFMHLIETNSQFAVTLLRNLARRIDALNHTVIELGAKTPDSNDSDTTL
ncbi:MAG: cyclic nucleotide-binding domain-containing protein [Deltaproteobacteria bacterium]|nr:cyclic nucleotide-binding domain-containing protein [Deltaproteobacteria bacterium]